MEKGNTLLHHDQLLVTSNKVPCIGIFQLDIKSNHIYWNSDLKEIHQAPLNFTPRTEDLYGNCDNLNQKDLITKAHKKAINEGIPFELTYGILTQKGEKRIVRTTVQPALKNGYCTRLHGTTIEISQFNNSQVETVQQLEQLNAAEILANSGSWKWNLITDKLIWSDNFYNIFDHDPNSPISYEVYLNYVHQEDKEKIAAKFERALKDRIFPESVYRIQLSNGTIKTLRSSGKVIINDEDKIVSLMGTCQDITEQVAKEQELFEKKQQLELSESINQAGSWQFSLVNGEFKWSDNLYTIFDLEVGVPMNFEKFKKIIHPADVELVNKKLEEIKREKKSHTFTHRVLLENNTTKTVRVVSDAITDLNGNVIELIGTTQDITKKLDIEIELTKKNQLLNFAEHLTTMGYWRYKPATDEVFWSDNVYIIFDHPKHKKITFDTYFQKIHPEDREVTKLKIDQSRNDHKPYNFTHRIITDNNVIKIIQIIGKVTYNNEDGLQELLGTCLDITENQTKELELEQKNHQLNSAEKMAMIGYWQWNTATNEVFWSDNLRAIYGHDKNKPLTFETYINYIHEDDRQTITTKLSNAMQEGDFPSSTYKIQLDDGTIKIIKSIGKIVRNSKGEVVEMSGTCQDISEARHRELELIHKNHQLSLAERMANLGSFQWQPKNEIFKWSDNHYRIYGYEPGEHIDLEKSLAKIYPPDLEKVKQVSSEIVEGIEHNHINYRIQLDKDTIKTLEVRGVTSINEDGDLEITGTTQDITSRVKTEQEINEKNHLLSVSEEMAMMGSWKWNPGTGVSTWSDNLYKIYGIELHTPITIEVFLSKVHPDDVDYVNNQIKNILDSHKSDETLAFRILRDDGCIRSLELLAEVIEDQNGNIVELIGSTQDVTEKVKAREEIKEKNQLLSFAEEMSNMGSWHLDIESDILKWSDNLYKIFGFNVGSVINMDKFYSLIHPGDIENVKTQVKKSVEGDDSIKSLSFRIILDDESIRSIQSRAEYKKNHLGKVIELAGTAQDITEKLKIEKDILEKNHMLNLAEELTMIGYWQLNVSNGSFIWSNNMYRIYGFDLGIAMNFDLFLTHTHPDDREFLIHKRENAIITKKVDKFTQRILHENGDIRFCEIVGKVITDRNGNATKIIGSSRDITEEILSKQKILETNKNLEKSTNKLTSQNKQLAEFNQITSHNLRSPVGNLNALLQMYKNATCEDKKVEIFDKFEIVIKHLNETLNALVEMITIKKNGVEIKPHLDFEDVLLKTKQTLAAELIETKAIINFDFSQVKNVNYNPIYLESIFLNLVSNAIKYRSPDRVPKIFISSKQENEKTLLEFKDNGVGIDLKSHGHKLFGLNKVFHKHPEAKGIGLFITKAQILAMGGSITVESEVNVGSTFFVTLN
ncbi:sensor histidine kinase [Maribacter litoralis]|uniref:histidine kinase n=1 Tax=Maribacter litoralis TaxID=2059726 RepID=A0A653T303_9FLAO|nr:PAS domain-containing sensor histidine kinase [Maribacter litoralis]VXB74569.1 PAS domain S-box-containing protein [Maribacter litoralis]